MVGVYVGEAKKEKTKRINGRSVGSVLHGWVLYFLGMVVEGRGGVLMCLGDRVLCTTMKNTGQSDASI